MPTAMGRQVRWSLRRTYRRARPSWSTRPAPTQAWRASCCTAPPSLTCTCNKPLLPKGNLLCRKIIGMSNLTSNILTCSTLPLRALSHNSPDAVSSSYLVRVRVRVRVKVGVGVRVRLRLSVRFRVIVRVRVKRWNELSVVVSVFTERTVVSVCDSPESQRDRARAGSNHRMRGHSHSHSTPDFRPTPPARTSRPSY